MRSTVASATGMIAARISSMECRGNGRKIDLALVHGLGDLLGIHAGLRHRVSDIVSRAAVQDAFVEEMINNYVGERHVKLVHAVDQKKAADRALNGDGGMNVDEALRILRDAACGLASFFNKFKIEVKFTFHF